MAPRLWSREKLSKAARAKVYGLNGLPCEMRVSVAKLKYQWTKNRSTVISDSVEFDEPEVHFLPEGKNGRASIAIKIPAQPGFYTLKIKFDNTNVEEFAHTSADHELGEFFTAEATRVFLIAPGE